MKNNKKYTKSLKIIFSVVMIFVVLLSNSVIAFADSGQIGNTVQQIGSITIYDKPNTNHGLDIDLEMFGFATTEGNSQAFSANNYTFNNVGVTYPPTFDGASYKSDQYARYERIPTPTFSFPYRISNYPFAYGYYAFLSNTATSEPWFNKPMSYRYLVAPIGSILSYEMNQWYNSFGDAVNGALNSLDGGTLHYENTYAMGSTNFNINGLLSSELLAQGNSEDGYAYSPYQFINYCLVPIDAVNLSYYYYVTINGYNFAISDAMQSLIIDSSKPENNLDMFFDNIYIDPSSSYNSPQVDIYNLAHFYEDGFGLELYEVSFNVGDFLASIRDYINVEIVTDFQINFGVNYITSNSKALDFYNKNGSYPIVASTVYYDYVSPYTQRAHLESCLSYSRSTVSNIDLNMSWLGTTIGSFFDIPLFGYFSLGDILYVVLGIGLVILFIKLFSGG